VNTHNATSRTAAAIEARRRATRAMLQRVQDAITQLQRRKSPVTFPAIARQAGVSRTFLYENLDARRLVTDAVTRTTGQRPKVQAEQDGQQQASWRERALNAEDALKAAHTEISTQRTRIGQLLGHIRDLEEQLPRDAVQRVTSENTTLKQRTRQLTQDNRTLEERLQAARANTRFQDRRIAQLEAQLLEQPTDHH
jgi:hypothetical protein